MTKNTNKVWPTRSSKAVNVNKINGMVIRNSSGAYIFDGYIHIHIVDNSFKSIWPAKKIYTHTLTNGNICFLVFSLLCFAVLLLY